MAREGNAESAGQAVAYKFGDAGHVAVLTPKQVLCQAHASCQQISHRRNAHGGTEALEECRARQCGLASHLSNSPAVGGLCVYGSQCSSQAMVA